MSNRRIGGARQIFVLSGPSGSGKTTLANALLADRSLSKAMARSVSLTTRPRRAGERHGRDYFFVSVTAFKQLLREKKILEWTRYLGYYYGTARDFVDEQLARGRSMLLCLDVKGAQALRRAYPHRTVTVFVMPPNLQVLSERIHKRAREKTVREIRRRLAIARSEIAAASTYDYCLVNDDLRAAARELKKIVRRFLR